MSTNCEVPSKIAKKLYLKPDKADVYFVFGATGERIPAHKCILSSGSDVFDAMFYGPLKEEGDIQIVDASAEAFKEFLRVFYFNHVDFSIENVSDVMYLGRKYDVAECQRLCVDLLTTNITVQNVVSVLDFAIFYEQEQLLHLCESAIVSNPSEVLKSTDFLNCKRQVLDYIINIDRLPCSEPGVFEACMSWTKAISKQEALTRDIVQANLGDSFYKIRFGSMSLDEFAELTPKYFNLFSAEEYNDIIQLISKRQIQPSKFTGRCRVLNVAWDECSKIGCFRGTTSHRQMYKIQTEEVTTFSTNTMLLLGKFQLDYLYDSSGEQIKRVPLNISIAIVADSKETQAQFDFNYSNGPVVTLPNPILIKPGIKYDIRLTFPSNDFYAKWEVKSTVNLGNNIVVEFHNSRAVEVVEKLIFNLLK